MRKAEVGASFKWTTFLWAWQERPSSFRKCFSIMWMEQGALHFTTKTKKMLAFAPFYDDELALCHKQQLQYWRLRLLQKRHKVEHYKQRFLFVRNGTFRFYYAKQLRGWNYTYEGNNFWLFGESSLAVHSLVDCLHCKLAVESRDCLAEGYEDYCICLRFATALICFTLYVTRASSCPTGLGVESSEMPFVCHNVFHVCEDINLGFFSQFSGTNVLRMELENMLIHYAEINNLCPAYGFHFQVWFSFGACEKTLAEKEEEEALEIFDSSWFRSQWVDYQSFTREKNLWKRKEKSSCGSLRVTSFYGRAGLSCSLLRLNSWANNKKRENNFQGFLLHFALLKSTRDKCFFNVQLPSLELLFIINCLLIYLPSSNHYDIRSC